MTARWSVLGIALIGGCAQVIGLSELDFGDDCEAGEQRACYDGPPETKDHGICGEGTQVCGETGWGPCEGDVLPAVEVCYSFDSDESCDGHNDCPGLQIWRKRFGGPRTDNGIAVTADARGVVIAGTTQGDIDFGGGVNTVTEGTESMFVAAFADDGTYVWDELLCSSGWAVPNDLALLSDGRVVVTGFATGCQLEDGVITGFFLLVFERDHGMLLEKKNLSLGSGEGELYATVDDSDRIVLGGTIDRDDGGDAYLASWTYTTELKPDWAIVYPRSGDQRVTGVATEADGTIHATGVFAETLQFSDTATYVAEPTTKQFYWARFDAAGTPSEIQIFGPGFALDDQVSIRVAVNQLGDVRLAGVFTGTLTFEQSLVDMTGYQSFVAYLHGGVLRSKDIGDATAGLPRWVVVDDANNFFVGGAVIGGNLGFFSTEPLGDMLDGHNAFVGKIDGGGSAIWGRGDGDSQPQEARDIAAHPTGGVYVVGQYQGTMEFDPAFPLEAAQGFDVFLVRIGP